MQTSPTTATLGPIIRREECPNGATRVITHWVIKGERTKHERSHYGYTTLEALLGTKPSADSNIVHLGIGEDRFDDGSSIFYREVNVFD